MHFHINSSIFFFTVSVYEFFKISADFTMAADVAFMHSRLSVLLDPASVEINIAVHGGRVASAAESP